MQAESKAAADASPSPTCCLTQTVWLSSGNARLISRDGASTIAYAASAAGLIQTAACLGMRMCEVTRLKRDTDCGLSEHAHVQE